MNNTINSIEFLEKREFVKNDSVSRVVVIEAFLGGDFVENVEGFLWVFFIFD